MMDSEKFYEKLDLLSFPDYGIGIVLPLKE
jgi:hypothetical protein